jgi:hypothetical protein
MSWSSPCAEVCASAAEVGSTPRAGGARHSVRVTERGLEHENLMVLNLSQALLGLVFDNLQAASVEVVDRAVVLHFWLQHVPTEADTDDLDDIVCDFEALIGRDAVIGG